MRLDYVIGLDLAKRFDRTAFVALERTPAVAPVPEDDEAPEDDPLNLRAVFAYQPPRGTSYGDVAEYAASLALHPALEGRVQFAVDVTGVGEAVLELIEQQPALDGLIWPVTISPGQKANRKGMRCSVPKKDLVDATLIALQRRRLKACPHDLYDMEVLRQQLFAFKRKVDPRTLTASYEAIDESVHDDAALALLLAVWLSNALPLEDHGEFSDAAAPHVVLGGMAQVPRPAETWRPDDDPACHRPSGVGPARPDLGLPAPPNRPPTPRD